MTKKANITDAQINKALKSLTSIDLRKVEATLTQLSFNTEDFVDGFLVEVDAKLPQPIFRRISAAVAAAEDALSFLEDTVTECSDMIDEEQIRREDEQKAANKSSRPKKGGAKQPQRYLAYSVKNNEFVYFSRDGSVPRWTKYRDSATKMEFVNAENLAKRYPKLQIALVAV